MTKAPYKGNIIGAGCDDRMTPREPQAGPSTLPLVEELAALDLRGLGALAEDLLAPSKTINLGPYDICYVLLVAMVPTPMSLPQEDIATLTKPSYTISHNSHNSQEGTYAP